MDEDTRMKREPFAIEINQTEKIEHVSKFKELRNFRYIFRIIILSLSRSDSSAPRYRVLITVSTRCASSEPRRITVTELRAARLHVRV